MIKKKVVILKNLCCSVLISCLCLIEGCSASPQQEGEKKKIVSLNLVNDPATLDPRLSRDSNSSIVLRMLFEGLTRIGPDNSPELGLAHKIDISKDLKTYTFHLRSSKWSNGDPLTAQDFLYSWRKVLSPHFQTDTASALYVIKNAKAVKEGTLNAQELGLQALNPLTLVVELEYPTPYFLELVSTPVFFPVNQSIDLAYPNWATKVDTYVSNGPFLLKTWKHHDVFSTVKNPNYWDADAVRLDGVEMIMVQEDTELKLFEKKQLSWMGSPLSIIPTDALHFLKQSKNLHVTPIAGTQFVRVNTSIPALNHPLIRRAFALAVNRAALVEHVLQGGQIPATGLVPPALKIQTNPYFIDGDKNQARELFEQGLSELGLTRETFPKLTLTCSAVSRSHLICQALQQQWNEALGIQLSLESLELKVYFDHLSKQNYQLMLGSWLADFNDPVNFLELFQSKSQGSNNTNWEDPEYAQKIEASFRERDKEKRYEILKLCEKSLMEAMPVIPLYHYTMLYLKDDRLQGAFLSSLGRLDLKWASLDD